MARWTEAEYEAYRERQGKDLAGRGKVEGRAVSVAQERVFVPDPEWDESARRQRIAKMKARKKPSSELEELFARKMAGTGFIREHRFAPPRRWRFDFAWVEKRLAVEIDGGNWNNGRHNRGSARDAENEKMNSAQLLGWRVLHFTGAAVKNGEAERVTREALR
jgi:very-short-patch-repair endonuclease